MKAPARSVLVGADSLAGNDLQERLDAADLSLGELVLVDPGAEVASLRPVRGELRVATPRLVDALDDAELVLVAVPLPAAESELVRSAAREAVVLDLTGTLGGPARDACMPGGPQVLQAGIQQSPAAGSLVAASLARAAVSAGADGCVAAVIFDPVSELGRQAIDELHEQAVATLNFRELPREVLGGRVVHDVGSPGAGGAPRETRLAREAAELAPGARLAVLRVVSGTFHGVAVACHAPVDPAAWRRGLDGERRLRVSEDEPAGPASAVQEAAAVVGRLVDDGQGGAWAWAAADSLRHGSVGNAVDLLEATWGGRTPSKGERP